MEKKRILQFDILRIIACFSVIMLHCSAQFWYTLPVTDSKWMIANSYDALFRFGVPIFVMISGALFLNRKEINVKKLYTHNILRMIVAYVCWTVLYGLFKCRVVPVEELSVGVVWKEIISGSYHLWFLPMITGIYMLLPILKKWIDHASKKDIEYFLILFLVLKIGRETVKAAIQRPVLEYLDSIISIDMVCGYLGYFILGYYFYKFGVEKKWHKWIYLGGLLGAVFNVLAGNFLSRHAQMAKAEIYDSFTVGTFFIVVALFTFATEIMGKSQELYRVEKLVGEISASTFGIYLVHIAIIDFIRDCGFHSMSVHPIIGIPLLAFICFVIGYMIVAILRRVPILKKLV